MKEPKEEQLLELKEVPQVQECEISTGSQSLSHPIIEKFLERRLIPCESNKFIQNLLVGNTSSSLEKFRFLEKQGIDLWGVKVIDPDAALLSY